MAKEICIVCGREIDSRGMSGHMKTHSKNMKMVQDNGDGNNGVISYPSNEQKIKETNTVVDSGASRAGHPVKQDDLDVPQGKQVKKPVASKPASNSRTTPKATPKPTDPRGELKTETQHKEEWKGLFRE